MTDSEPSDNEESIVLRVQKAKKRDIGKNIIRIDTNAMEQLDVQTGDVISVKGQEESAGIAWPSFPQDNGLGIVRFDARLRKNTGTKIDDNIELKKVDAETAQSIVLAPSNVNIKTKNPRFESFVKRKLNNYPVTIDDIIYVNIGINREISFKVINLKPKGVCVIKQDTQLIISEQMIEGTRDGAPLVTYNDVGGLNDEIKTIREIIDVPLHHPEVFKRLGTNPPRGILLIGPPGAGKTLLAKAIANESEAHFILVNGSEIISKYHGESERKLRKIFIEAEERSPSIIFFDHIDALFPKSQKNTFSELLSSISIQLAVLMDGLHARGNVIVIGATNNPEILDSTIKRPGRFDRIIKLTLPDEKARLEIFQIHTKTMPLSKDVSLKDYVEVTKGYSGAVISAICREAAMSALRRNPDLINMDTELLEPNLLEKLIIRDIDFKIALELFTEDVFRE